jgi:hypothetical protein
MDQVVKIAVNEFRKEPDGTWVCITNSDVSTRSSNVIRITPGMTFRKGTIFCGVDIAEALDQASGN